MTGGTISNNTCHKDGGGVYNYPNAEINMDNGTITGNTANVSGGGIYSNGKFNMNGGNINNNVSLSPTYGGGGVCINGNKFTMNGGDISNNTANKFGGGVYLYSGTFEAIKGTITNSNTAAVGSGVYYDNGTFNVIGDINAQNVYLATSKSISIIGNLTNGASISIQNADGAGVGRIIAQGIGYTLNPNDINKLSLGSALSGRYGLRFDNGNNRIVLS